MSGLTDYFRDMASETGPLLSTSMFGEAKTGTVFSTGAGNAVVDGPTEGEEFDGQNRTRRVSTITAIVCADSIVANPEGKTFVHDGETYTVRAVEAADEGMKTLRASRQRTPQTGRQAEG